MAMNFYWRFPPLSIIWLLNMIIVHNVANYINLIHG